MSPWLKQDDGMGEHRKTRRLLKRGKSGIGLASFGLHELAMLHSAKYLTDGFVDQEFVQDTLDDANVSGKMRAAVIEALVAGGQWTVVDGGWSIHDYLDHNPSRAESEAKREVEREKKAAAGRKGAAVRWGKGDDVPEGSHGTLLDGCQGNDGSGATDGNGPVPSRPVPSPPASQENARPARSPVRFSGKVVPADRVADAEQILADFNDREGTNYKPLTAAGKPSEQFKRILGAAIDHPDLTVDEARTVHAAALAAPNRFWGAGPAQPGHIWGPKVTEPNREKAAAAHAAGASEMDAFREHKRRLSEREGDAA